MGIAGSQQKFIYKDRWWARFGPWLAVYLLALEKKSRVDLVIQDPHYDR